MSGLMLGEIFYKWANGQALSRFEKDLLRLHMNEIDRVKDTASVSNIFLNNSETGITDAPADGKFYSRINNTWLVTTFPHYKNLTSQIDGSATHFTIDEASWNIIVSVNGLVQGEEDYTYDLDGLGFTLDTVLVSGDELEVWVWPGSTISNPGGGSSGGSGSTVLLSWDRSPLSGSDSTLSSFALWTGTIPANPSFPATLSIPATFTGDAATNLTCYALSGVTRVLTGTLTTDSTHIYVKFTTSSPVSVTGFELVIAAGGGITFTTGSVVYSGTLAANDSVGVGHAISLGQYYSVEGTGGPWLFNNIVIDYQHAFAENPSYSDDSAGGVDIGGFAVRLGTSALGYEQNGNYARIFFRSSTGEVWIRVNCNLEFFPTSTGSLGYQVRTAVPIDARSVTLSATTLYGV